MLAHNFGGYISDFTAGPWLWNRKNNETLSAFFHDISWISIENWWKSICRNQRFSWASWEILDVWYNIPKSYVRTYSAVLDYGNWLNEIFESRLDLSRKASNQHVYKNSNNFGCVWFEKCCLGFVWKKWFCLTCDKCLNMRGKVLKSLKRWKEHNIIYIAAYVQLHV